MFVVNFWSNFIIIIIIIPCDFFTLAFDEGLSLESECQHDFSSHQDSSQYSGSLS